MVLLIKYKSIIIAVNEYYLFGISFALKSNEVEVGFYYIIVFSRPFSWSWLIIYFGRTDTNIYIFRRKEISCVYKSVALFPMYVNK